MVVNGALVWMYKEAVVAYINILFQHSPEESEENHE